MNLTRLLGLYLAAGLLWSFPASAQVIYVDVDAAGMETGSNWTDAYADLQSALAWATAGWEIWVAEGQYVPTSGSDRAISFVIPDGVQLYGGFNGTETTRIERDWTFHESILSGDVGVPDDSTDNSYHVIDADATGSTTVLDGFTVRHGRASSGVPPTDRGAGLYAPSSDLVVRNTVFRWNGATRGGGMYFESGAPLVEDCLFDENLGSGAVFDSSGTPTLRGVSVYGNGGSGLFFLGGSFAKVEDSIVEGGNLVGVFIIDSSPHFVRTTVRNNDNPNGDGGGVIIDGGSPVFEESRFEGNSAINGGAIDIGGSATPLFLNSTFSGNTGSSSGGAVSTANATPTCIGCTFERNRALGAGAISALSSGINVVGSRFYGNRSTSTSGGLGAILFTGSTWMGNPVLIANSLFVGNEGPNGAAIAAYGVDANEARIVNTTFAGNEARGVGGAIYASNADGLEIQNAIFWGNEAPLDSEIHIAQGGAPVAERAIVAGGYPSGTDILDQDPLFVRNPDPGPDGNWGTDDDDYGDLRLREGSPGVDYGLQGFLPPDTWDLDKDGDTTEPLPIDLNGDVRVLGAEVDLGAYEGAVVVATEPDVPPADVRLAVYPNPANDYLTIEADAEDIEIVDVLGRVVLRTEQAGRIDVSGLPVGVYVVRAGNATRRFTKVR